MKTALKLALDALEKHGDAYLGHSDEYQFAITKVKEALAQQDPLFKDLISQHEGLAEELAAIDSQPEQEPTNTKLIHTVVSGCSDCPSCVYDSGGRYSCEKSEYRKFEDRGTDVTPTWCPLMQEAQPEQEPVASDGYVFVAIPVLEKLGIGKAVIATISTTPPQPKEPEHSAPHGEPVAYIDMSKWPPVRFKEGALRVDIEHLDGQKLYTHPPVPTAQAKKPSQTFIDYLKSQSIENIAKELIEMQQIIDAFEKTKEPEQEPVAQHRDTHSHMMVVASRAVDYVTNNGRTYAPIKTYTRAICKAIQADKNLLAKLAPQRKPMTDEQFTQAIEVAGIPVEDVEAAFAIKDLVEAAHGIKE